MNVIHPSDFQGIVMLDPLVRLKACNLDLVTNHFYSTLFVLFLSFVTPF